jgi:hypothetical protein
MVFSETMFLLILSEKTQRKDEKLLLNTYVKHIDKTVLHMYTILRFP